MTSIMNKATLISALALAPMITSCATKKFVRTTVTPIEQKVSELDSTTKNHAKNIEELERGVARADERAQGAQGKADSAVEQAALARGEAAEGRSLALKGLTRADELDKNIKTMDVAMQARMDIMQDYQLVATDQVLFGLGRWELDVDAMAGLDAAVAKVGTMRNFVIEVQGFTDSTGPKQLNLELSRKRADAVLRYLTMKHNVPLHRIFVAGYGQESQVAGNKTRDGRKMNRRVEMKVFVAGDKALSQVSSR